MKDFRVCSMKFDLQGIQNEADFVDPSIKQVSVFDQVEISQIFQCEGLLLCVTRDKSRLLVWNPYLGQMNWTQQGNNFSNIDKYALGYDKNRNHKILRIFSERGSYGEKIVLGYEIFDLSSNTLKVRNVNADWNIDYYQRGVYLKGHAYFLAKKEDTGIGEYDNGYIISFNFTTERFGKLLPLPFETKISDELVLSCVREEQLAALHQSSAVGQALEIWVTNKIDPCEVSWSKFLRITYGFRDGNLAGSFFVDEERRVAVVVDQEDYKGPNVNRHNQKVHIIGQDGCFKSVYIGEVRYLGKRGRFGYMTYDICRPLVCSSFVPSSVSLQTKQPRGKLEESETN
ncbi:F-box/kelch-repeat protein [Raphanus sativus]|nr:F-box/kelch-repeat protein [Raphanus sativus]